MKLAINLGISNVLSSVYNNYYSPLAAWMWYNYIKTDNDRRDKCSSAMTVN